MTTTPSVVCGRLRDLPVGQVVPASVGRTPCSGCGETLLISASSRALVAAGRCRPVCVGCLPADRPLVPVMTRAQAEELAAFDAESR